MELASDLLNRLISKIEVEHRYIAAHRLYRSKRVRHTRCGPDNFKAGRFQLVRNINRDNSFILNYEYTPIHSLNPKLLITAPRHSPQDKKASI